MPGDRLALAVLIGREIQLVGVCEQRLELADLLALVATDHVERLETVIDVDAETRPTVLTCRPSGLPRPGLAGRGCGRSTTRRRNRPEKAEMVFAFAGDSTMTRALTMISEPVGVADPQVWETSDACRERARIAEPTTAAMVDAMIIPIFA